MMVMAVMMMMKMMTPEIIGLVVMAVVVAMVVAMAVVMIMAILNANAGAGGGIDPPPPGRGNAAAAEDEPDGFYMTRNLKLPHGLGEHHFSYTHKCRKLCRASFLCKIPNIYHSKIFIFDSVVTFLKLTTFDHKLWKEFANRAQK